MEATGLLAKIVSATTNIAKAGKTLLLTVLNMKGGIYGKAEESINKLRIKLIIIGNPLVIMIQK